MKIVVPLLVGVLCGLLLMNFGGFILGALVGYLLLEQRSSAERLQKLELRLRVLAQLLQDRRAEAQEAATDEDLAVEGRREPETEPAPEPGPPVAEMPEYERAPEAEPVTGPTARPEPAPLLRPETPSRPSGRVEELVEQVLGQVKTFFFGGNTLVRVGVVVLFFGFVFLVKYAVDNDYFPVELRLAATAAAGLALVVVGWRLREKREEFALALQGGGAAIFYLTIFAAYRLYAFLPSGAAFGLLVATTALCAALALLQNAQSLAVLALLGGFFAPVLASTGEGSHVALFSYYAVLNGAVLALAWFRPWRPVHLVGFFCTFGIAGLWVANRYEAALFASTEPFLILFFLAYFVVALLHARHRRPDLTGPVDATLVFGLPVAVFSLQAALVEPFAYGLAWSAFGFGVFYAAAAYVLYRRSRETLLLLVESFSGIGLVLGTMVLPFALDATWTGTGWALEGAALVWLGLRQRSVLLRLSGLLLQLAAGVSFVIGYEDLAAAPPFLNRIFFGCLALALSALFTAYLIQRARDERRRWEAPAEALFLAIGLVWWLAGGIGEIARVMDDELGYHLIVSLFAATSLLVALLRKPLEWRMLRVPALLLLPFLFVLFLPVGLIVDHPFEAGGFAAWPLGLAVHLFALRRLRDDVDGWPARLLHAGGLWFGALVLTVESAWLLERLGLEGAVWPALAYGLVPVLLALAVTRAAEGDAWPFGARRDAYLRLGVPLLLVAAWLWSFEQLGRTGDPAPLPYLPLANPADLVVGLGVVAGAGWYRAARRGLAGFGSRALRAGLLWGLAVSAFVWVNATLARSVHAYAGVPYDLDALLASTTFQTALTICWTLLSVVTMAVAARRGGRTPWLAAAALLGVTVVKLFAVDLSSISTVARIVTFLVVGLLLLLVGYLAPVPPERSPASADVPENPTPA